MTPQEYCAALEQALSPMPPEERQETIRYYLEFLEEASEEERAALGTPQELAAQLLRDSGIFPTQNIPPSAPKSSGRTGVIIALLCTSPIWLPLLLVWYVLLLTVLICIVTVPITFVGVLVVGIWSMLMLLSRDFPLALLSLGIGLMGGGLAVLVAYLWRSSASAAAGSCGIWSGREARPHEEAESHRLSDAVCRVCAVRIFGSARRISVPYSGRSRSRRVHPAGTDPDSVGHIHRRSCGARQHRPCSRHRAHSAQSAV